MRVAVVGAAAGVAAWQAAWHSHGSIAAGDWLPAGLLIAALLATALLSGAAILPVRTALLAVAGTLGLAGWAGLSLRWSPLPSLARDEALLRLVYACALALPLVLLRSRGERLAAAGLVAAAAVGVAFATAVELAAGSDAAAHFGIGRLEFPISYANAEAAVLVVGLWPALAVGAARGAPMLVRALGIGGAGLLLAGWLATQSKGGGIAIAIGALVLFGLSPQRLRLALPTLLAAACAGAATHTLTEPYRAETNALEQASSGVGRAMLLVAAAAGGLGLVYALLDRRIVVRRRAQRIAGVAAAVALAVAVTVGAVAAVSAFGRPDRALGDAWDAFSTFHKDEAKTSHLVSLGGSNRYDFYRVALAGARDHPLAGVGARGFGPEYLLEGRSSETPARTHSLPLELLLEEGAIGLLLLLAALIPALALAVRSTRRGELAAAAALAGGVGWLAQASVDWTWTFPAAGIPFFLLLGIGAGGGSRLGRRAGLAAGAGVAVLAATLLALPWFSSRLVDRALADPASATGDLRLARRLDPIAIRPLLAEAALAPTPAEALPPLREAARREPRSVGVRYTLGTELIRAGRKAEGLRELEAARALAPRDPITAAAVETARG